MNHLQHAKELAGRGLQEQIDWLVSYEQEEFLREWLTLGAEYDKLEAQAEGEPITDKRKVTSQ